MPRRVFDLFIFSSFYISLCAVIMVFQTNHLLRLSYSHQEYYFFVFFSTLCSYNFHWYLTPKADTEVIRMKWTHRHKWLNLALSGVGLLGALWLFFHFEEHRLWIIGAAFLTFLYTAPKIPLPFFRLLRKIAFGKTLFLSTVWVYVTTILPIILSGKPPGAADVLFCASRFFLVYSICIIFDYRDRESDKKEGIKSMVTFLDESGVNKLFYTSVLIFVLSTASLSLVGFSFPATIFLLLPGIIVLCLYGVARRSFSDYLYYFVLDGLMMFSALFTSFLSN